MNKTNHIPLTEDQKIKLENYFRNCVDNEDRIEECADYLVNNKELLNVEDIKIKAVGQVVKEIGRFLKKEEELKSDLFCLTSNEIKEMIGGWLEENIADYLEDGESTEAILIIMKREIEVILPRKIREEIKNEVIKVK